jgi:hypothetical protein
VSEVPYLVNADAGPNEPTFITYDDTHSIALKAAFARGLGLAGMMWWEASDDKYGVLLTAANAAWLAADGPTAAPTSTTTTASPTTAACAGQSRANGCTCDTGGVCSSTFCDYTTWTCEPDPGASPTTASPTTSPPAPAFYCAGGWKVGTVAGATRPYAPQITNPDAGVWPEVDVAAGALEQDQMAECFRLAMGKYPDATHPAPVQYLVYQPPDMGACYTLSGSGTPNAAVTAYRHCEVKSGAPISAACDSVKVQYDAQCGSCFEGSEPALCTGLKAMYKSSCECPAH